MSRRHAAPGHQSSPGIPRFRWAGLAQEAAVKAIRSGPNQYAPSLGNPLLRQKLSEKMEREAGLNYDPDREITGVSGATEGIAAVLLGLLNPEDEVILFEPFYDSYPACVAMAGATARFLPLQLPTFRSIGRLWRN